MNKVIDFYKDVVIQIATPYTTGTGFYLRDYNLIVTNEHVIRENRAVVVEGDDSYDIDEASLEERRRDADA